MGLRQRGATEAALALLRRAQQAFPGDFWINHDLGMALGDCHPPQNEEAIRFLTVAVALRPDSAGVRLNLGNTLTRAGRLDEAIVACRQAIGLKPDYSMAHLQLGLVLEAKGHLDEAVAACRRASQLKPDYADAYYSLGTVLIRMGRGNEAVAPLRRAIDLMPDLPRVTVTSASRFGNKGSIPRPSSHFERGHELGSRRKDWPYPSAQWVSECRRRIELDRRLAAVLRGEAQPGGCRRAGRVCPSLLRKEGYVAAARFFPRI